MLKAPLRSSWILAAVLTFAHCGATVVIAVIDGPPWLQMIAITALCASLAFSVSSAALLRTPRAAVAIEISADDLFSVVTRRGDRIECEVLGSTFVTAILSVLNLKERDAGAVRHVVVLPDSLDAEDFRRLRVWLRWKCGAQMRAE